MYSNNYTVKYTNHYYIPVYNVGVQRERPKFLGGYLYFDEQTGNFMLDSKVGLKYITAKSMTEDDISRVIVSLSQIDQDTIGRFVSRFMSYNELVDFIRQTFLKEENTKLRQL